MRQRTVWTWKLIAYPLVVLPFLVWFNFQWGPKGSDSFEKAPSDESVTAQADPLQPIHGVTQRGELFFCYPDQPKVTEFCLILR